MRPNDVIQEASSTESYILVPCPVVSCNLMCKTVKDLSTYHNTQTPNASSNDANSSSSSSVPKLVDSRSEDSDNDENRVESDSANIKQGISLRVARVVME